MADLNYRQSQILIELQKKSQSISDLKQIFTDVTKVTLNRDLKKLSELGLIVKSGEARATKYETSKTSKLLVPVNTEEYFNQDVDERKIISDYNLDIFQVLTQLETLFTNVEKQHLEKLNSKYKKRYLAASTAIKNKELERFTIELSWKSSKIEGNTYSLLDTEALIKLDQKANNKSEADALMILNHKKAFDYILKEPSYFSEWHTRKILELHLLLTSGLDIENKFRAHKVSITGTNYKPLDNQWQLEEALQDFVKLLNKLEFVMDKALLCLAILSYLQVFEDGNKRTSRLCANACLLAADYAPLSFRSINESEYKKAVLLFYEQNNLSYLKQLFIEQFEFAALNYLG
jgi:Fic family protein